MTQVLETSTTQETTEQSPVHIRKLGHVVFRVRDVERTIKFYAEILNFRVSERNEHGQVFLNACGDHHTIAIAQAAAGEAAVHGSDQQLGLSHFAMEVASLDDLFAIRAFLRQKGVPITSEGRKGPGCNIGLTMSDPDGYHVEVYCSMDQLGPSNRTRPAEQWRRADSLEAARDNPIPATW